MSLRQTSFLITLLLLFAVPSCATYKKRIIEIRSVNKYPHVSIVEGISIAADPYYSGEKSKQGLYLDVTSKGFLPVNFILRNDTNERVRILKESVELIDEHGTNYRPVSGEVMSARFKKNPIARFLAGSVVSVVIGAAWCVSTILANGDMEADWRKKEIPDQLVLQPGTQMNGFVYFKVPEERATTVSKLCMVSEMLTSRKTVQLELIPGANESPITFSPVEKKKPVEQASPRPNR